jgi:Na+-transporting methylmalonyl-CoA/oxaloacetate decarboxylase gamma subunit
LDNVINQGLALSVVGLLIAFAFMGLFILTMVVLQALFPSKKEEPVEVAAVEAAPVAAMEVPAALSVVDENDDELSAVAAAVVALAGLRSQNQSKLGDALVSGHGSWWMVNQVAARRDGLSRK